MILSASRRTDIPNYYAEWFLSRLRDGFLYVRNPMNPHQVSQIDLSPSAVDCIVFWTKNPADMLPHLDRLQDYHYAFQFTFTGYDRDIEPHLPDKRGALMETFKRLSDRIGPHRVVWRYDPILINPRYTLQRHPEVFDFMAKELSGYTEKVVISFVDFYTKTSRNMQELRVQSPEPEQLLLLGAELSKIAKSHSLNIESCAETLDLSSVGIAHGSCIGKAWVERVIGREIAVGKDRNQRAACGCERRVRFTMCSRRFCVGGWTRRIG